MRETYTDCQSLLRSLAAGPGKADSAKSAQARTWRRIFAAIAGEIEAGTAVEKLVWLPAHVSAQDIDSKLMSNGKLLTRGLWRANRLVDAFAKRAAQEQGVQCAAVEAANAAKAAAWHAAALLGTVTKAANHFVTAVVDESGVSQQVVLRDSAPQPSRRRHGQSGGLPQGRAIPEAEAHCESATSSRTRQATKRALAASGCAAAEGQRAAKRMKAAARAEDEANTRFWFSWAPLPARPRPADAPTAAERLAAVRSRVLGRAAAPPA